MTPDPARSGWNRYAYPTNPNSYIDPSGLNMQAPGTCQGGEGLCPWEGGGGGPVDNGGGGFGSGTDANGFGWNSGPGSFGGPGNPYGLPSGAGALQAGASRYLSIINGGWDPALGIQHYEYSRMQAATLFQTKRR